MPVRGAVNSTRLQLPLSLGLACALLSQLPAPGSAFAVQALAGPLPGAGRAAALPERRGPASPGRAGGRGLGRGASGAASVGMQFGGLGSLLRGGGGAKGGGAKNPDDPSAPFKDTAPSWEALAEMLHKQQTAEERSFRKDLASGRSKTHPLATLRLFDAPDGTEPRVTLYRDFAAWCPYCEKVWLQLEEKRIPYRVEKVNMRCYGDKPEWFMRMNPSGGIPVAKIDGMVISESNDIMQTLEDRFPENKPLLPSAGHPQAPRVGNLLRLERQVFSAWFRWLVSSTRAGDAQQKNFESLMDEVDAQLKEANEIAQANGAKEGRLFLGDEFSLVDCMFAPFLERMAASVPYYKGLVVRGNDRWPHVTKWFEAMEKRESFANIMSDYYTHVHDLPPQIGRCMSHPEAAAYAAQIDGTDGSWKFPLKQGIEPVHLDDATAKREAAERMIANHGAIVKFCLRAVGSPGYPGVSSPLADPNAVPDERFTKQVDSALRHAVNLMLGGDKGDLASSGLPKHTTSECLKYLVLRTSVPRDMRFGAARQLRAHLYQVADSV